MSSCKIPLWNICIDFETETHIYAGGLEKVSTLYTQILDKR